MDKKNVGLIVACSLCLLTVVLTFSVLHYLETCNAKGCNRDKLYGSDYCRDHTCKMKDCNNIKNENSKYCPEHEEELRLERERILAEEAKKPDCLYTGCMHKAEFGHSYCVLHECAAGGCENCETAGSIYCIKHTCIEPVCNNRATEDSGRCSSCEKAYKTKNTTKKKTTYKYKNNSNEVEWPDCDDYEDYGHFMDDWEGEMPDGSNAEDYWDDW